MSKQKRLTLLAVVVIIGGGILLWRHLRLNPFPLSREPDRPLSTLKRPRIVVEKAARRLTVYSGDNVVKTYPAAFGFGRGDKQREGDGRTPEGEFYICVKNERSKFTLSLGLSYPNAEDAARGLRDGLISRAQHDAIVAAMHEKRCPPWNTPLGGEIMIHGCGADRDWTAGCVALDDEAIKELFAAVDLGTSVVVLP